MEVILGVGNAFYWRRRCRKLAAVGNGQISIKVNVWNVGRDVADVEVAVSRVDCMYACVKVRALYSNGNI